MVVFVKIHTVPYKQSRLFVISSCKQCLSISHAIQHVYILYVLDKGRRGAEVLETEISSIHPLGLPKLLLTYALGKV